MYTAALCLLLSSDSFETREAAERELTRLAVLHPDTRGRDAAAYESCTSCPEAVSRLARIRRTCRNRLAKSYVPRTVPLWPYCDCYPIPMMLGDVRSRSVWPVHSYTQHTSDWRAYRETTEQEVRTLIRKGLSYDDADRLLSRMWQLEVAANHDGAKAPTIPAKWQGGYP